MPAHPRPSKHRHSHASILSLPDELLLSIFLSLDSPSSFALACRALHRVASHPTNKLVWLERRYFPNEILYELVRRRSICTVGLVEALLVHRGAVLSRYLTGQLLTRTPHYHGSTALEELPIRIDPTHRLPPVYVSNSVLHRICLASPHAIPSGEADIPFFVDDDATSDPTWLARQITRTADGSQVQFMVPLPGQHPRYVYAVNLSEVSSPPGVVFAHDRDEILPRIMEYSVPAFSRALLCDLWLCVLSVGNDLPWYDQTFSQAGCPPIGDNAFTRDLLRLYLKLDPTPDKSVGLANIYRGASTFSTLPRHCAIYWNEAASTYIASRSGATLYEVMYEATFAEPDRLRSADFRRSAIRLLFERGAGSPKAHTFRLLTLLSFRGQRLLDNSKAFADMYKQHVSAPPSPVPPSMNDSNLCCRVHACLLLLHIRGLLEFSKNGAFISKQLVSMGSIRFLLEDPSLKPMDMVKILELAARRLPPNNHIDKIVAAALPGILRQPDSGAHIIELAARFKWLAPVIERCIDASTASMVLTGEPAASLNGLAGLADPDILAGVERGRLAMCAKKPQWRTEQGRARGSLPLYLALLTVIEDRDSPALKAVRQAARDRKLHAVVKAYACVIV